MIRLERARFDYGTGRRALHETDLDIGPGLSLVLGPNGAGKSSLLKLAAGVERPRIGRVFVDGFDLWIEETAARRLLAYVPEHPDLTPYASLDEVARLVCALRGEPPESGERALARAGLEAESGCTVRELSMGQRRRALLAMAWIGHPANVLLDEPLEAMDRSMRDVIVAWVTELAATGLTVLVATHEIEPFAALATRAICLADGHATTGEELPVAMVERMAYLERLAREGR